MVTTLTTLIYMQNKFIINCPDSTDFRDNIKNDFTTHYVHYANFQENVRNTFPSVHVPKW